MDNILKASLPKLREKLLEALQAVLPIVAIVLVLCFTIAPISPSILICFLLGAAMIIVGMLMADLKMEDFRAYRRIWKPTLFRLVVLPLALVLLAKLLHISALNPQGETLVMTALIPAFAPAANVVAQFSQIYGRDAKYAGLINAVTMLGCIVSMPLLIAVYQM